MKYKLEAYSIKELGQRANQEDSMFPEMGNVTNDDRLFILCDGMGGHEKGEVASQTVCEAMAESVMKQCPDAEGEFTEDMLRRALSDALDALDKKDDGSEKKMGTTMTFLKLHRDGATIAHIGDSRVYHIRSGATADETEILFQTSDHSLVNDLVKSGNLTPEEAKNFERKNVITRAMQPNLERRPRADIYHTQDIKAGDYFMLCSDGILEQMEDENIRFFFSNESTNISSDADRVEMIRKATADNKDNHTAFVIHISEVEGVPTATPTEKDDDHLVPQAEAKPIAEQKPATNNAASEKTDNTVKRQNNGKTERNKRFIKDIRKHLGIALGIAALLVLVFFLLLKLDVIENEGAGKKSQKDNPKLHTEQQLKQSAPSEENSQTSEETETGGNDTNNANDVEQNSNKTEINDVVNAVATSAETENTTATQVVEAQPAIPSATVVNDNNKPVG